MPMFHQEGQTVHGNQFQADGVMNIVNGEPQDVRAAFTPKTPPPSGARYQRRYENAEDSDFPPIHKVSDWLLGWFFRYGSHAPTAGDKEFQAIIDAVAKMEDDLWDVHMERNDY